MSFKNHSSDDFLHFIVFSLWNCYSSVDFLNWFSLFVIRGLLKSCLWVKFLSEDMVVSSFCCSFEVFFCPYLAGSLCGKLPPLVHFDLVRDFPQVSGDSWALISE